MGNFWPRIKNLPAAFFFLFAAILLYGLFGSPTPDDPGLVEAAIGGLLILSIGLSGVIRASNILLGRNGFLKSLQLLFLTGLILPTLAGVYFGNDHMLMLRDIAAFLFLGLPLFLSEKLAEDKAASEILCRLLISVGILFSLRTLMPVFNIWVPRGELLYLSNSPLTLFAAVFLTGRLWVYLSNFSRANIVRSLGCATGLAILIAAMLLDVQRATIGAVLITFLVLAILDVVRKPRRAIVPLFALLVLGAALYPIMGEILQAMAHKTAQVGFNMRLQEAQAVFNTLAASPLSVFIGLGWGSVVASPAVGGLDVNYTHSLLTTMALKGGVITLGLAIIMAAAGLYQIMLIFQQDRVKALALFWPFIVPVLLYASHKSLDFGLLLLVIGVWSIQAASLHHGEASCKTKEHQEE